MIAPELISSKANFHDVVVPFLQQPGLPIARVCAVLSLATAAIHDVAIAPYAGKETGETALLRTMPDDFDAGDVVVFDRYYGSFLMVALLQLRGADVCTRLHQRRTSDFRLGKRLGDYDHLVVWNRPDRPAWMSEEMLALDYLRCKTPHMIERHLWVRRSTTSSRANSGSRWPVRRFCRPGCSCRRGHVGTRDRWRLRRWRGWQPTRWRTGPGASSRAFSSAAGTAAR